MPTVDYYKLFDLGSNESEDAIRAQLDAERRQLEILKRIPAKSADARSRLELLDKAAEILLNPEARRLYDQTFAGDQSQDSPAVSVPDPPISDVPASSVPAPAVPVSAAPVLGKGPAVQAETKQPVTALTSSKIQIPASLLAEMWTCPHCQAQ